MLDAVIQAEALEQGASTSYGRQSVRREKLCRSGWKVVRRDAFQRQSFQLRAAQANWRETASCGQHAPGSREIQYEVPQLAVRGYKLQMRCPDT